MDKVNPEETINLLGWSLGGNIALAIASLLESQGYKNINVILLDTVIADEEIKQRRTKQSPGENLTWFNSRGMDSHHKARLQLLQSVETSLSSQKPEQKLRQSRVILYKATLIDKRTTYTSNMSEYVIHLNDNNLADYCEKLGVINIEASHNNIHESEDVARLSKWALDNYEESEPIIFST